MILAYMSSKSTESSCRILVLFRATTHEKVIGNFARILTQLAFFKALLETFHEGIESIQVILSLSAEETSVEIRRKSIIVVRLTILFEDLCPLVKIVFKYGNRVMPSRRKSIGI